MTAKFLYIVNLTNAKQNYDIGRLAPEELKSCLVSVGYSIGKDRQGELDFQRILAVVDPNNTGNVVINKYFSSTL